MPAERLLTITADDLGLWPSYDEGIVTAARAGALDAASVMALRLESLPVPLRGWDGALGLHLEPPGGGSLGRAEVEEQLGAFERLVARAPDYLDGHHHCHAGPAAEEAVMAVALELGIPVRSVDERHRRLLRDAGVPTPDRLIGRYEEAEPVLPTGLSDLPSGWTEWMVHPGHADPASGSSYDAGREEDLAALLSFRTPPGVRRVDQREAGL